jgi:diaminopimelate epimerase
MKIGKGLEIEYFIADSAGNITCFVLTSINREWYQQVGKIIMEILEPSVEQVAYVLEDGMEMSGHEFCGNASRAYGLWLARKEGQKGEGEVMVRVSGANQPLKVVVNTKTDYTRITMPLPMKLEKMDWSNMGLGGQITKVELEGIHHFVCIGVPCSEEAMSLILEKAKGDSVAPALGVLFFDPSTMSMIPVVHVRGVDTVYLEGSCGSGTTAVAAMLAEGKSEKQGEWCYHIGQPAGEIGVTVTKKEGQVHGIEIWGPVSIQEKKKGSIYL